MWLCPQQRFPNNLLQMLKLGTSEECSVGIWVRTDLCLGKQTNTMTSTVGSSSL